MTSTTTYKLLIIDPQNDFMDQDGAALPVTGAVADTQRTVALLERLGGQVSQVVVTLDTHPAVAIERPAFWKTAEGSEVVPFTQITAQEVRDGKYCPKDVSLLPQVLSYLDSLEAGGKYILMIWPAHCVQGTWGQEIQSDLNSALARWSTHTGTAVQEVNKGMNSMTEQYSAVQAEVPLATDEATQRNIELLNAVAPGDGEILLVAGQALSHCVRATMLDVYDHLSPEALGRVVLLSDAMSPVGGFEAMGSQFLLSSSKLGVKVKTTSEL